ncbi:hypothetical protein ACFL5K_04555 [Gemmatimonadota bacterium]
MRSKLSCSFARIGLIAVVCCFTTLSAQAGETDVHMGINLSLIHGISLGHAFAGGDESRIHNTGLSLGLFSTKAARLSGIDLCLGRSDYSASVRGMQVGGVVATAHNNALGLQLAGIIGAAGNGFTGGQAAGLISAVGDKFTGIQFAGLIGATGNNFTGGQAAGLISAVGDKFTGIQFTGLISAAGNNFTGFQVGGMISAVGDHFSGIQVSGIINAVGEEFSGVQVGGIINAVGEEFSGVQVGGLLNAAGETFSGLQISGLMNAAVHLHHGVQIGLINRSKTNSGIAVGPYSRVNDVGLGFELATDETRFVHLGLRSGTRRFFNVLHLGLHPGDVTRWSLGWSFGLHQPLGGGGKSALEVGATISHINEAELWTGGVNRLGRVSMLYVHKTSGNYSLFAGPSINLWDSRYHDGSDFAPWSVYERNSGGGGRWKRAWPGLSVGLRTEGFFIRE